MKAVEEIVIALQILTLTFVFDLQRRVSRLEARIQNNCNEKRAHR